MGDGEPEDLGGIEQALDVVVQAENGGAAVGALIGADAFKNSGSVMQGVGQHADLRILCGKELAVKPDFFILVSHVLTSCSAVWNMKARRSEAKSHMKFLP